MSNSNSQTSSNPSRVMLGDAIQAHLGEQLRALYGDPSDDRMPLSLRRLADRVAQVIRAHTEPVDQAFVDGIMAALPHLRAFAISLAKNVDRAEDLVQDTVLKAIGKQESFEAGTNIQAWLFTILRNAFFSIRRKTQREVEDSDGSLAATLVCIPDQEDRIAFQDLEAALAKLPQDQREAVLLVGMEGMQYEEAASALGIKVGTVKSRRQPRTQPPGRASPPRPGRPRWSSHHQPRGALTGSSDGRSPGNAGPLMNVALSRARFAQARRHGQPRKESTGIPGRIQVTQAVCERLAGHFAFEARGPSKARSRAGARARATAGATAGAGVCCRRGSSFDSARERRRGHPRVAASITVSSRSMARAPSAMVGMSDVPRAARTESPSSA